MPKEMLTGTLEEQCAFLYDLGREKMETGNYVGAIHAFGEIVKYAPDFRDTAELLETSRRRKAEQRFLIVGAIMGGVAMIAVGSALNLRNDLFLLALALVGTLVGYVLAIVVNGRRQGDSS